MSDSEPEESDSEPAATPPSESESEPDVMPVDVDDNENDEVVEVVKAKSKKLQRKTPKRK